MKRKIFYGVVVLMVVAFLSLALQAGAAEDKADTPAALKGGKIISSEEVMALIDKKEAKIFDFRSAVNYGKGHIPSAVAMPYKGKSENRPDFDASQDEFEVSKLPADKNAKIVYYSDGPKGWKSYKAAVLSIKAGYRNILWYRDGYDTWVSKQYPVEL